MAGKSRGLVSLAGTAGRLLAWDGHRDEASFWPGWTAPGGSSAMSNNG
jgi:hypothetical protein